jgi:small-conductance mechanosensitive channel
MDPQPQEVNRQEDDENQHEQAATEQEVSPGNRPIVQQEEKDRDQERDEVNQLTADLSA